MFGTSKLKFEKISESYLMVKTAIGLSSIILLHTKTIFKIIQGIPVILEIQDGM